MIDAMIFILWMIMFIILFGFLAIKGFEIQLNQENIKEEDKISIETFLMVYSGRDFGGKLHMTMILGANIISMMLFFWTKNSKELRKK
jgi:hypothetical protein